MKRPVVVTAVLFAILPSANAAEWTGFYAGVLGGVSSGGYGDEYSTARSNYSGFSAGAFGGARFDVGTVLLGAELGGYLSSMQVIDQGMWAGTEFGMRAQGTARATVALDFDSFAPYVAAGVVAGQQRMISATPGFGRDEEWHAGLTVAAGVDFALTENVFARGELTYATFGAATYDLGKGPFQAWPTDQFSAGVGLGFAF